ncbi:MAG: hypothetical protein Q4D91_09880 [Lautropia sp.]|nr:hypothetical protein [Lautropia sp.]
MMNAASAGSVCLGGKPSPFGDIHRQIIAAADMFAADEKRPTAH